MFRRLLVLVTALVTVGAVSAPVAAGPGSFPDRIPLPDGFFPEGIAIAGHTAYVGSLVDGAIVQQDLRTGATTPFAGPPPGPPALAVGMDVDAHGRLWVAGGGPFLPGIVPTVRAYDTATGELVYERAVLAGFVNDVIVTAEAAWFTDSFLPQLIRVPLDGTAIGEPESVGVGGDYVHDPGNFNLNGIVATGDWLVVTQSVGPAEAVLHRLPADADAATLDADRIELDGVLPGADGLVLVGRTLHVVAGTPGVVEVSLDGPLASGSVVGTTAVPGGVTPTTAATFGSRLYVVDAKFPTFGLPTETYDTVAIRR